MINKKQYEDKDAIKQDKENFLNYALNKGIDFEDIQTFLVYYYENLKTFKHNLNKIKEN